MSRNKTPAFVEKGFDAHCYFATGSIWKADDAEVAFSFLNFDYPVAHTHQDFCEILFVYSGEIENYVNGETRMLGAGDCCFIHRDDIHMIKFASAENRDFIAINFLVRYDFFEKLKNVFGEEASKPLVKSRKMNIFHISDSLRISIYDDVFNLQTTVTEGYKASELMCKKIIIDLLYQFIHSSVYSSPRGTIPDWVRDLLEETQKSENFSKKPAELIGRTGYSYSYVAREFKKYVGCSFVYFNAIKLNYAKELLMHSEYTVISIAGSLGFNSLSHFNSIFKNTFGLPPSAFRRID